MNYTETETDSAVDVIDPPPHFAPEDLHTPAGTSGPRAGILRRATRCAIAVLVSAVIILSWHIYSYRQIIHVMQMAVDQQNVLLDNAMGTRTPPVSQMTPATTYHEVTIDPE